MYLFVIFQPSIQLWWFSIFRSQFIESNQNCCCCCFFLKKTFLLFLFIFHILPTVVAWIVFNCSHTSSDSQTKQPFLFRQTLDRQKHFEFDTGFFLLIRIRWIGLHLIVEHLVKMRRNWYSSEAFAIQMNFQFYKQWRWNRECDTKRRDRERRKQRKIDWSAWKKLCPWVEFIWMNEWMNKSAIECVLIIICHFLSFLVAVINLSQLILHSMITSYISTKI